MQRLPARPAAGDRRRRRRRLERGEVVDRRPRTVVCADWSANPRHRAVWVASLEDGSISRIESPRDGWTAQALLATGECIAIDAPLGLPETFLRAGGSSSFPEWLVRDDVEFEPVLHANEWSTARPFVRPFGTGSWNSVVARARACGIELRRRVEVAINAESVFKLVGGKQVGGAARALWAELRALRLGLVPFALFPFEASALAADVPVVAEIYPAAAYRVVLPERPRSKLDRAERARVLAGLPLDVAQAAASDHDFDAAVTAAAVLRVLNQGLPLVSPQWVDRIAEGAILCV